jgi:hypothetical protein
MMENNPAEPLVANLPRVGKKLFGPRCISMVRPEQTLNALGGFQKKIKRLVLFPLIHRSDPAVDGHLEGVDEATILYEQVIRYQENAVGWSHPKTRPSSHAMVSW